MVDGRLPARGSNRADRTIDKPVAPLFGEEGRDPHLRAEPKPSAPQEHVPLPNGGSDYRRRNPSGRSRAAQVRGEGPSARLLLQLAPGVSASPQASVTQTLEATYRGWFADQGRLSVSVTAKNVLGHEHREFVGAPALGCMVTARLTYEHP